MSILSPNEFILPYAIIVPALWTYWIFFSVYLIPFSIQQLFLNIISLPFYQEQAIMKYSKMEMHDPL